MFVLPIDEASQVSGARRKAAETAEAARFGASDIGRVAIVATELATNLIKHTPGGEILVGTYEEGDDTGIEILALDRGRGIPNLQDCLVDGYSSAGTAGNGLGAIFRQSTTVNVVSWPGMGTAILARLETGRPSLASKMSNAPWGVVSLAMPGEDVCGDAWAIDDEPLQRTIIVADGLGHGLAAAEAAVQALTVFKRHRGHQVPTLLDYIHGGLRSTRGAAVSIARIDNAAKKIIFAGVGNVAGVFADDASLKRMVSLPGTAGYNARKIQAFEYPFHGGLVILHSDGLATSWSLDRYPGLAQSHPTLIAAVLYRDFGRKRDDVTIVVARGEKTG